MKNESFESQQELNSEKNLEEDVKNSPHYNYYLNKMNLINRQSQEFQNLLNQLRINGFEYNRKQFSFEFNKTIIKSSRDSVKYQIEYGYFKTFIYASFAQYNFESIDREQINRGKFGKILQFINEQQSIVAKSFIFKQFDSNRFNSILKEIFWSKFTSILKIGPKFIKAYGFDLICLKNSCQFLMEKCQSNRGKKETFKSDQKIISDRIRNIIAILHSFQAIHGDMKISHIAYSQYQTNFVIIDYGMADFIRQQIGQMTSTRYFGTYSFSCPDMKKAFFLKSVFPVDLFYNDLYAIEKCEQFFREQQQYLSTLPIKTIQYKKSQWPSVLKLFMFKFYIFEHNLKGVIQLYHHQLQLVPCFRQIIKIEQKGINQRFTVELWELLNLQQFKQNQYHTFEIGSNEFSAKEILFMELLKSQEKPKFHKFEISETFIKKMFEDKTLQTFLNSDEAMESTYSYIFQQKPTSQNEINQKKQIANYIYLTKSSLKAEILSQPLMIRQVLLIFQDYFYTTGNLSKLKSIQTIFRFTCQTKYLKAVQKNICQVFLKDINVWVDDLRKDISSLCNLSLPQDNFITKNIRNTWEWLITQPQLRKSYLQQKDNQFIKSCANIIEAIERSISSKKLNIIYNQEQFCAALKLYQKQLLLRQGNSIQNFQLIKKSQGVHKLKLSGILHYRKRQIKQIQDALIFEVLHFNKEKQFTSLQLLMNSLKYTLRQTLWSLTYYIKIKNMPLFENCLQACFQNVFITDRYEGISIFFTFTGIFYSAIESSQKTKQLLMKFLGNIQALKILNSIKSDAYFLKSFVLNFFSLVFLFSSVQFDKKQVIVIVDKICLQMKAFFKQNNDQWWAISESEIFILLQIDLVYYQAFRNSSWAENFDKMMKLLQKIIKNNYSFQTIDCIMNLLCSYLEVQKQHNRSDQIWRILKQIEDKEKIFGILNHNLITLLSIINNLCRNNQFKECLNVLEQYGRYIKGYYHQSNLHIYYDFVGNLPQNTALQMFVDQLDAYSLKRISTSPRLSFIFFVLLNNKPNLFNLTQKQRYIKLISFGLSKINTRYTYYFIINGSLLYFYSLFISFKNSRKQFIHLYRQARVSHQQSALIQLNTKKQNKCKKIKTTKYSKSIVTHNLLKKIKRDKILNKFKETLLQENDNL